MYGGKSNARLSIMQHKHRKTRSKLHYIPPGFGAIFPCSFLNLTSHFSNSLMRRRTYSSKSPLYGLMVDVNATTGHVMVGK